MTKSEAMVHLHDVSKYPTMEQVDVLKELGIHNLNFSKENTFEAFCRAARWLQPKALARVLSSIFGDDDATAVGVMVRDFLRDAP